MTRIEALNSVEEDENLNNTDTDAVGENNSSDVCTCTHLLILWLLSSCPFNYTYLKIVALTDISELFSICWIS